MCISSEPEVPNPAGVTAQTIAAQLAMTPLYYQLAAGSALGGTGTMQVPSYDKKGRIIGYNTVNYSMPSSAETNKQLSDYYTQAGLDLGDKYGSQQIALNRRLLQEADPEGWNARMSLYDNIMGDLEGGGYNSQLANTLEDQILADLQAGGQLDPQSRREFEQQARRGQAARGNILGDSSAFAEAAEVGQAAENRRQQRKGTAMQFLSSGKDKYGRHQQALSNLGSFIAGNAPQGSFNSVAPNIQQGGYNPGMPQYSPTAGMSYAASTYGPAVSASLGHDQQQMSVYNNSIGAAGSLIGGIAGGMI